MLFNRRVTNRYLFTTALNLTLTLTLTLTLKLIRTLTRTLTLTLSGVVFVARAMLNLLVKEDDEEARKGNFHSSNSKSHPI